jgi:methionyl aminopeptidase
MIERNDPCFCGSGKKYKKCHLNKVEPTKDAPVDQIPMIKTSEAIEGMRAAGIFNGKLMDYIRPFVMEGTNTGHLNTLIHEYTCDHGHTPACLGYQGYPKSCCISVNNVVCHGIPNPKEILKNGDIVNVDLTTIVNGYYGDSSETFCIGSVSKKAIDLVRTTANALIVGIRAVKPHAHLSSIAQAIEPYVQSFGYSVVRQYTGHGIGTKFHEFFSVYHHREKGDNILLLPGMTLTIEPMINAGGYAVTTDAKDKWTVRTKDGSLSAQFEHTILITSTGCEILTLTPSQIASNEILSLPGQKLDSPAIHTVVEP